MNIDNLKEGIELKNYQELCTTIDVKPATGKSKQIQLKEFSQCVKYRKEGHKFIIEKILGYPDPVMYSSSNSPYIKLIETLLVAHFVGTKELRIESTYKKLFQTLCMVSDNYDTIYRDDSYKNFKDNIAPIDEDTYKDFRRVSYKENKRKIKAALDSMKKKSLIQYTEEIYVCCGKHGNEVHRKPTEQEMSDYLRIGQTLLKKYGCSNVDELNMKHLRRDYENDYAKEIKEKLGWNYKYKKVVIYNGITDATRFIDKAKEELILQARKNKIEVNKAELNSAIKKMINRIGENNHNNATSKMEELEKADEEWGTNPEIPYGLYSIFNRAKDSYLPAWHILSDYYISGDQDAAKDKAKDYPQEENINITLK